MIKFVAPALALGLAALYFLSHRHKNDEQERIDDAFEAGAYPEE